MMCMRPLKPASAEHDFPRYQNELNDPKENENKSCTLMKYRETFFDRYTARNTSSSEVKISTKAVKLLVE